MPKPMKNVGVAVVRTTHIIRARRELDGSGYVEANVVGVIAQASSAEVLEPFRLEGARLDGATKAIVRRPKLVTRFAQPLGDDFEDFVAGVALRHFFDELNGANDLIKSTGSVANCEAHFPHAICFSLPDPPVAVFKHGRAELLEQYLLKGKVRLQAMSKYADVPRPIGDPDEGTQRIVFGDDEEGDAVVYTDRGDVTVPAKGLRINARRADDPLIYCVSASPDANVAAEYDASVEITDAEAFFGAIDAALQRRFGHLWYEGWREVHYFGRDMSPDIYKGYYYLPLMSAEQYDVSLFLKEDTPTDREQQEIRAVWSGCTEKEVFLDVPEIIPLLRKAHWPK